MPDQEREDKVIVFGVRAAWPSEWTPGGAPAEKLPATYTPEEQDLMRDLTRLLEDDPKVKDELYTIHELKAYTGATLLSDEEVAERWPDQPAVLPSAPALPSPDENRVGRFHGPDAGAPATERQAALLIFPNSGTARRKVLDFVAGKARAGATDEEVSLALDMRLYTAAPRRNELVTDGWLEDSGRRRETTTGAHAAVWVLTKMGLEMWKPREEQG